MSENGSRLAAVYRTMDALSLQHDPNLAVPTEVRGFGAELSAEIADLSDQAVVMEALKLDELDKGQRSKDMLLSTEFDRNRSQPPRAYEDEPDLAEHWAMQQLCIGVVSRRFTHEFASRFPEKALPGYKTSEDFLQGRVVAFRTIGQYLARPL